MKRFALFSFTCLLTAAAFAQMAGLPVADTAVTLPRGAMRASGGAVLGDDLNLYGARLTRGMSDRMSAFGGAGMVDPDHGDSGWGIQAGAIYRLFLDLPFEVAARGTLGYANVDQSFGIYDADVDITTFNVGALASKPMTAELSLYGYLGVNYTRSEVSADGSGIKGSSTDTTDTETDPAFGGGMIFAVNEKLSLYGELMHIDDLWIGVGARISL